MFKILYTNYLFRKFKHARQENISRKLFNQFRLSDRVPENNFYRRLKAVLNLEYLYQLTKEYYGDSGQKYRPSSVL